MEIFKIIVVDLLGDSAILVGLMALIGLVLQKKPFNEVITGTIKTIVGMLVFTVGSGAAGSALSVFQEWFSKGFGIEGVLPMAETITSLAQEKFGTTVALVMLIGFVMNLVFAKFTRFKNIFLTGQHNLFFAAMITIMMNALGVNNLVTVLLGGTILGFSASFFPELCQPYMKKLTGDNSIALGHYVTVGYAISGWIGSKVGNPEQSTENLKLPKWLSMFKDYIVGVGLTVIIFFYIAAIAAGSEAVEAVSGGVNWLIYPLTLGLTFAAALYTIITGIRLLLGEIVQAFVGISEKLIPDARPALDCPVVFPYAPTATILGFLSAYAGGLVCMIVMGLLGTMVIIPVALPYFFIGATAGVIGNTTGGWKGCVAGAFVVGILISVGPALSYPILSSIGLTGTAFTEVDFNVAGLLIYYVGTFVKSIFGF